MQGQGEKACPCFFFEKSFPVLNGNMIRMKQPKTKKSQTATSQVRKGKPNICFVRADFYKNLAPFILIPELMVYPSTHFFMG
ncbi:hypothetical protein BLX87_23405 [Bacillus sp. VT-16-64]|nr:hypothetical protein BLX87_23405 [Bacillus sp. VT-16-64]